MIDINDKFEKISEEVSQMKTEQIEIHNRISELKSEFKSIREAKEENIDTERKKAINSKIINIIKNGFVENLLTKKIIPNFCSSINSILSSFVDYKIVMEYDNKKLFVYKEDVNGLLSSASKLSGYETLMTNIAFRLAINNINKLYKTNFFIIDEAFAFCDEQSIAKISNLFTYMRKIYDFVLVVSHNEQIKSYTDIDIPIKIRNGFSYVNMINDKNKSKFSQYADLLEIKDEENKKKKTFKI
jgi:DNA repair exonuclease SbcCD ATPase subunit